MAKQTAKRVTQDVNAAPVGASRSGETVTVACKLPNGFVIRGMKKATRSIGVQGGGLRDEIYFKADGRRVTVFGTARAKGADFRTRVVGGYALTTGVPKDLFDEWLKTNEDSDMVRNGLVCAFKGVNDAASFGRENAEIKSGLEPLNPLGDKRQVRSMKIGLSDVTIADEQKIEPQDEELVG